MHRDKIQAALAKALSHLDEAVNTMTTGDSNEKALADSLWTASAETEYAVFLLTLMKGDRTESTPSKGTSPTKQPIELDVTLAHARNLLQGAGTKVDEGNFERAYETAWSARNLLLKAQEQLEKKRKETKK